MNYYNTYVTESECVVCGKKYIKTHKSQMFCSNTCRIKKINSFPKAYILSFKNVNLDKNQIIAVFSNNKKVRDHIQTNYPDYIEIIGGVKWVSYNDENFVLLVKKIIMNKEF